MQNFKVFVNFKTYPEGTGERAEELAKACEEVSLASNIQIIPVVQTVDLYNLKKTVQIPVWVQHLDFQEQGQFTGWENLEAVIEAGASGTLLNHSEHQIPPGTIKQTISRIKAISNSQLVIRNFQTMVCCKTLGQMERLVKLKPDYIAYEISQIIGTKTSITDYDPQAIKHSVEICGEIPLLVGAGIHKAEDLKKAKELGASGILISSAVVLAENPKEKLTELISGLL